MSDDLDSGPGQIMGMLAFGAVFGGCGLLMAWNLFSGDAEFVHGPRTGHPLVTILGENVFTVVAMVVCLLLGALGFVGAFYSLRWSLIVRRAEQAALDEKISKARARGQRKREARAGGAVLLECPHCEETSRIPAAYAGRKGLCPKCNGEVRVPKA